MIKVAFLSFYQKRISRGVENWLKEFKAHCPLAMEVKIFSPAKIRSVFNDYSHSFWRKLFLDPDSRAIFNHSRKIFSQLKNFDIIIPLNGGWQTLLVKIASLVYKNKMVLVGHPGLGYDERWNLLWRPDLYISLTRAQGKWVRRYYAGPLKVIPDGANLQKFKPQGEKMSFKLKPPIILCVVSLQKQDFLKNLILALKNLNVSLVIAGSGDKKQEKEIDSLASQHLHRRYLRRQFQYSQMPRLYRAVNLFVYPNPPWESFGIVFLEAMASNLPVIATDDPLRREIVGDAGLFIQPGNPQSISKAIKKAMKINWDQKPYRQAKKFSWNKVVKKYKQVFQNLIK
jgi:glycosyltransferase involved in cell wall biosynthesis